ncbi:MAG: M23 family metallopeptidase [Daejeonella sp.]|uniref:peptidoglycan DD-metalloendopeptidase family protein n=1 Tax=Daejeonella sp. TaxID=2805397 RepID=UPI003C709612
MNFSFPKRTLVFLFIISTFFGWSCQTGPFKVFKSASPHELYERKLISSGLGNTAIGKSWIEFSDEVLEDPLAIEIPYLEKGYFPPEKVQAAAFSFKMERGQKLSIKLMRNPQIGFMVYTDIWEREESGTLDFIGSSDTLGTDFQSEINRTGTYILRLQPELLAGGNYTLEITSGPSLDYPLKSYQNNQIRSFWGDGRDVGARKHEGVDIFSPFRTPVLAILPGTTRVNESKLGGKVVWLRPEGKDYSVYYAHLDEQTVSDGQFVQIGDTIGRMGNTGNAITTPPHLHFGIYTRGGAVDPLPFINPRMKDVPEITSKMSLINDTLRTVGSGSFTDSKKGKSVSLKQGTIVQVKAASGPGYRVELPDGTRGFLTSSKLAEISERLRSVKIDPSQTHIYAKPDTSAAVKVTLKPEETVDVIGSFGDFDLINIGKVRGWIKR